MTGRLGLGGLALGLLLGREALLLLLQLALYRDAYRYAYRYAYRCVGAGVDTGAGAGGCAGAGACVCAVAVAVVVACAWRPRALLPTSQSLKPAVFLLARARERASLSACARA